MQHRNFYRRRLPHIDNADALQFVTFSLLGSHLSIPKPDLEFADSNYCAKSLDGPQWLGDPACAAIVESSLLFGHPERYQLLAWVIMPDHVHLLLEQHAGYSLGQVIGGIKKFTAARCNQLLGRTGQFWNLEFWDRRVRSEHEALRVETYILGNPVLAHLCESPEDYRWCHVWRGHAGE